MKITLGAVVLVEQSGCPRSLIQLAQTCSHSFKSAQLIYLILYCCCKHRYPRSNAGDFNSVEKQSDGYPTHRPW
jgi:hypothetical protein